MILKTLRHMVPQLFEQNLTRGKLYCHIVRVLYNSREGERGMA